MTLRDLIARLNDINSQYGDVKAYDTSVKQEEIIARAQLRKVIQALKLSNSLYADPSEADLASISQLLADRWHRIKDTDASYFINPTGAANQIYIKIAQELSLHTKRYLLAHLLPTLDPKQMLEFNNTKLEFRRYVMNPNFTLMMHLNEANDANIFQNTPGLVVRYGGPKSTAGHSNKHGKRLNQDAAKNKEIIGISYGELGDARLKERVYALSDDFCKDKAELFRALELQDRSQWVNFIQGFSREKLTALLLDDGKFTVAQAIEQLNLIGDTVREHAVLFAYTTLFIEHRKQGWEYGTPLLTAPGVFGLVYSKAEKVESAEALRAFLVNKDNALAGFHLYFEGLDEKLKGPMKNGVLGKLVQQFYPVPGRFHRQAVVMNL